MADAERMEREGSARSIPIAFPLAVQPSDRRFLVSVAPTRERARPVVDGAPDPAQAEELGAIGAGCGSGGGVPTE